MVERNGDDRRVTNGAINSTLIGYAAVALYLIKKIEMND